jgi:polyhydroxybutyrate depolymerase
MNVPVRALLLVVIVAVGVNAAACSRRGDAGAAAPASESAAANPATARTSTAEPATPAAASPVTEASGTCGTLPPDVRAGQTAVRTLHAGGLDRSYRLHVPAGAASAAGLPVVLNFHGLGSAAVEQEFYSGLVPLSDAEGFVLVTPDGTGSPRGWAIGAVNNGAADDLAFVDVLLDTLERELCIDPARVYATGMSNGAFFSSLLGCIRPERIAAIAPVAGVAWYDSVSCGRPIPVLAFHGVLDTVVPYEEGMIFGVIPYAGAEANAAGWAAHNGCDPSPSTVALTEHVERLEYEGCAAETALITVEDGGHTWPGAIPVARLGPTTTEISAAAMIWAFFADKAVP